MSDGGDSQDDQQLIEAEDSGDDNINEDGSIKLPSMLEELKGTSPTIWGFDYYKVIYCAAGALSLVMLFLYVVIPDPEVQRLVMVQGIFAVGLLVTAYYFRTKIQQQEARVLKEKMEAEMAKNSKSKSKNKRKKK